MPTADRALALVQTVRARADERITLFWVKVDGPSRQAFAEEIRSKRGSLPLVPIILRKQLFLSPNMVLSDFLVLIEENRETVCALDPSLCRNGLCILLLARDAFRLPQVSSPALLPTWFPVWGGKEVFIRIRDFDSDIEVILLNAAEARIDDLASLLFDLDGAMAHRMRVVNSRNPDKAVEFINLIASLSKPPASPTAVLENHIAHRTTVAEPRGYRPTLKDAQSLTSQLLRLVLKTAPDGLAKVSQSLASALDLPADFVVRPPLFAVMMRPVQTLDSRAKTCHSILLGVYGAYQLLTGAAHFGDYPSFPVGLIYASSRDLRTFLQDARREFEALAGTEANLGHAPVPPAK